jgi:hypothetical protein
MSKLIAGTTVVSMDEGCWSLKESNEQSPGSRGWRRYQIIRVIRGDALAEFRRDLGPARKFKTDQFAIPGGVVDETTGRFELLHTVGELYDMAEHLRTGKPRQAETPPTDLIGAYREQPERRALWRKKRSTFGSRGRLQRA